MKDLYGGATLLGDSASTYPLIICFHGSGDSCASWGALTQSLSGAYRILVWDRGDENLKPNSSVHKMLEHLREAQLPPPYVLIAHSYGGTFAREFLQQRPDDVAGMVLVETGQETALDPKVEKRQYKKQILGNKPLVVIRGNTLIGTWKHYENAIAAAGSDADNPSLKAQKQLLDATDKEDERLKKAQLALSLNYRYVHLPDCGHGVVQQRPDVVAAEVRWVMEHLPLGNGQSTRNTPSLWRNVSVFFRQLHKRP
ncbi:Alpha/Beta hydrolase protein [Truncatella angustata]|uniref:Alpha/Beta hydrolase protein n=1 Tax=Truncatella angustata TaxID=152316 RepID=A0A9P8UAT3_9PEZI|nr:Alpha/Beta hydrolase protein [Truncatella angustata]KAH6645167.1 Alpha/Beta hydrolase protein [Truncatella angustata]KAH8199824.1 hypothetical protein TruAng_005994 [Truncatella angustata]